MTSKNDDSKGSDIGKEAGEALTPQTPHINIDSMHFEELPEQPISTTTPKKHSQSDRKTAGSADVQSSIKSNSKVKDSIVTDPLPLTSLEHAARLTEPGAHRVGGTVSARDHDGDDAAGDHYDSSGDFVEISPDQEQQQPSDALRESAFRVSKLIQAELVDDQELAKEGPSSHKNKSPVVEAQVLETPRARFRRRMLVAIIFCASMIGMALAVVFTVRNNNPPDDDKDASFLQAVPSMQPSSAPTRQVFELLDTLDGRQQIGIFNLEAPFHDGGHYGYYTSIFDLKLNQFLGVHTDKKYMVLGSYGSFPQHYSSDNRTSVANAFEVDLQAAFSTYLCGEESCEAWFSFSPFLDIEPLIAPWHFDSSIGGDFFAFATHYGLDVFDLKDSNVYLVTSFTQLTPIQPVNGPELGTRRVAVSENGAFVCAMSNTTIVVYTTIGGLRADSIPVFSRNLYNESDGHDQVFTISASGSHLALATRSLFDEQASDQILVLNVETGQQVGQDFRRAVEETFGADQGWSLVSDSGVSLSANGTILALGLLLQKQDVIENFVQVFRLVQNGDEEERWGAFGQPIRASVGENGFGHSLDMSVDAKTLAVGAPFGESGEVHTFQLDQSSNEWVLLGDILRGGHGFGSSVSITPDGENLGIGNPLSSRTGPDTGEIQLFEISYV